MKLWFRLIPYQMNFGSNRVIQCKNRTHKKTDDRMPYHRIGLTLMDTSSKDFREWVATWHGFSFLLVCWFISFVFFSTKMTKLRIKHNQWFTWHNQWFTWMTMMTMAPESGISEDYKYLSWVYGVDRKICHEGHCSASRGLPSDAEQWSRVTDFSIRTIHPW